MPCHRFGIILAMFVVSASAGATTIDRSPRPAVLLSDGRFVAQHAPDGVTLYAPDGKPVHAFAASPVNEIAVTADGLYLLLACGDGSLKLYSLRGGAALWSKSASQTGLGYIYDASFAQDGRSLVVSGYYGRALVLDTFTGRTLADVGFPPRQTSVMSAALAPDGSTGALLEVGGHVHTFDVAAATIRDTGLTGSGTIRYSSDGRYFAWCNSNSGVLEHLRVAATDDPSRFTDVGQFRRLGLVRPTDDGRFAVTAEAIDRTGAQVTIGTLYDPATGELRPAWSLPTDPLAPPERQTDFATDALTGISTDYRLVTSVIDLADGTVRLRVDNSANFRPTIVSWSSRGGSRVSRKGLLVLGTSVACAIVAVTIAVARRRSAGRGFPLD